jgi:hypothetical protein
MLPAPPAEATSDASDGLAEQDRQGHWGRDYSRRARRVHWDLDCSRQVNRVQPGPDSEADRDERDRYRWAGLEPDSPGESACRVAAEAALREQVDGY